MSSTRFGICTGKVFGSVERNSFGSLVSVVEEAVKVLLAGVESVADVDTDAGADVGGSLRAPLFELDFDSEASARLVSRLEAGAESLFKTSFADGVDVAEELLLRGV